MRVDLDEFDTPEPDKVWKVEVYQDQSGEYLPHPNFHPWDDGVLDWTAKAHNALPALIAELRAARECARVLLLVTETDALLTLKRSEDMHGEAVWALDKLAQATKGDG